MLTLLHSAILIATSIKLKSPFPESIDDSDTCHPGPTAERLMENDEDANSIDSHEHTIGTRERSQRSNNRPRSVVSSRSVAHARNTLGAAEANTVSNIKSHETAFVQTFVLMYHMMIFGVVLLGIFLLDKYPLNGGSGSASSRQTLTVVSDPFHFDSDQFLSWMIVVVVYSCYSSWRRNDGKSCEPTEQPHSVDSANDVGDRTDVPSTMKSESPLRQRQQAKPSESRRDETSVISRGSSHTGLSSRRLEDIMLQEVLGHDDHDTIDDVFEDNSNHNDKGCMKRFFRVLGLNLENRHDDVRKWRPVDDILNPLQTLEWKGLLSVAYLIYQYCSGGRGGTYPAAESDDEPNIYVSPIWINLELVAFSSFLFLTGYNQTSYYYYQPENAQKAGLTRVVGILFRWNFAAIFISMTLGNSIFQHYVVCLIHSYFFISIWVVMRTYHTINYTKYKFRFKMLAFAVSFYCVVYWITLCLATSNIYIGQCLLVGSDIIVATKFLKNVSVQSLFWEWGYLAHLHHLAPLAGAMFAINKPIASLQLRKLESYARITTILSKGIVWLTLTIVTIMWGVGPLNRYSYSQIHSYFGIVPLLTFIYMRNLSHRLRLNHNHFFGFIGQYSLEIFILTKHAMYHGSFAVLLPGYPHLNFLLVSAGIIYVAKWLNNVTTILRQFLVNNDNQSSVSSISTYAAGVLAVYLFAKILCWVGLDSVGSIVTIVIMLGMLLYQVIMDMTWSESESIGRQSPASLTTNITKVCVPVSGVASIFCVAATCYAWSSASFEAPTQSCINEVNNGFWLPVDACTARSRLKDGVNYFGYAECKDFDAGKEWFWHPENNCGFRSRNSHDIKKSLLNKRVTFIGDSSVRNMFYSLCRLMGDNDAGGFEGVTSHADIRRLFPHVHLEYKWSPLSVDTVSKLKSIRTTDFSINLKPDLVLASSGVWDRLHMMATDEDKESHREAVKRLAFEMVKLRKLGISVVWMIPHIVNTIALNSDEKRSQMNEESLEETRLLFRELGVEEAADFVLDGPLFTKDRYGESFDGIDFPADVYDGGLQVLANAFDWILESSSDESSDALPDVTITTNSYLNAQLFLFVCIGLFVSCCSTMVYVEKLISLTDVIGISFIR